MFSYNFELSICIRAGTLTVVSLLKCDPRPFLKWINLNRLNAPPYFDGSNYALWKVRMRTFLYFIDDSVWDAVEIGWTRLEAAKST